MPVQTNQPPTRAERLGEREPDQVYVMRPSSSPPSREALLNSRQHTEAPENPLDNREMREFLSRAKQGGAPGIKGKAGLLTSAYRATKVFNSENSRITNATAFMMIGTAFFLDVLEMVVTWKVIGLLLGIFTGIFGALTFWTWFTIRGVPMGFANPKRLFTFLITSLAETFGISLDAVPLLGWLWTIGVVLLIIITRIEDKTGIKIPTSPTKIAKTGTIKPTT